MFTNAEMIVGLWLVPVVLCILVPLAMLCVWSVMRLTKKVSDKVEEVEAPASETLQSQVTT